jgi:hypothetical protein
MKEKRFCVVLFTDKEVRLGVAVEYFSWQCLDKKMTVV